MTTDRLEDMRRLILPVVIAEVKNARGALDLEHRHTILAFMTLTVENTDTPTLLGAYTQPVVAMGALRCRYLLEFLGITTTGSPPALKAIDRRRNSDIGIEHYTRDDGQRMARVTVDEAVQMFPEHAGIGSAWATVVTIANQRLAHPTNDDKLSGEGPFYNELAMTFATIPELLYVKFYDSLGVDRPSF
jgi:hypothetical protein